MIPASLCAGQQEDNNKMPTDNGEDAQEHILFQGLMDTTQYVINRDAFEASIVEVTAKGLLLFFDFILLLLLLLLRRS
jgi:hypothetical protein|tara:strand:+ start:112 stop:345 length:234 start_codon:yes stop_codon:yes gene_type:complete